MSILEIVHAKNVARGLKQRRDRLIIDRLERIFATDDDLNGGDFVQAVGLALKGDISWLDELIPRCEDDES